MCVFVCMCMVFLFHFVFCFMDVWGKTSQLKWCDILLYVAFFYSDLASKFFFPWSLDNIIGLGTFLSVIIENYNPFVEHF